MSYMYGKRGTCKETALTAAIRGELYTQDYSTIDWNAARNQCAKEDLYYPHPKVMNKNKHDSKLTLIRNASVNNGAFIWQCPNIAPWTC